ncbi:8454_t:CDS:2 [Dentiscutata erythropus]|uniref:8454_t:CDS:1 n=1 Tax=Dentiscutata erythropus TaxID=1348616 RepID=A0A9N9HQ60_9GLOM|nr:8454_t:CDS:2 [Dentiscutata erythropus]
MYETDLSNQNFIGLIANDMNNLATQFPKQWIPIMSNEINGLTKENQEIAQQYLNTKQQFAKVFGLAKTIVNQNALSNTSDDELLSDSSNNIEFDTNGIKKRKVSSIDVKNPLRK